MSDSAAKSKGKPYSSNRKFEKAAKRNTIRARRQLDKELAKDC